MDASDSSTLTLNGSTVSQWNDKSGNSNHQAQTTASAQPTYQATGSSTSKPTLSFDGGDRFTGSITAPTEFRNMDALDVFTVVQSTAAAAVSSAPTSVNTNSGPVPPQMERALQVERGSDGRSRESLRSRERGER